MESERRQYFGDDGLGVGELELLQRHAVDGRSIERGDAKDGGIQVVEGVLGKQRGDLRADAAEGLVLVNEDGAVSLGHGVEDGLFVERADGAQVNDLGFDAMFCR